VRSPAPHTTLARARAPGGPHDVAFTRDGNRVWVAAERAGRLVQLSVATGRVVRTPSRPGKPARHCGLALRPAALGDRQRAGERRGSFAVDGPSARAPFDRRRTPRPRLRARRVASPVQQLVVGSAERRLGLDAAPPCDGRRRKRSASFRVRPGGLWITDNDGGSLVGVGPRTRRVIGRVRVGKAPHHPTTAGNRVLVAVHGEGRVALVTTAGRHVRSIAVGAGPHGIAAVRIATR
jgi:hypothetical protein